MSSCRPLSARWLLAAALAVVLLPQTGSAQVNRAYTGFGFGASSRFNQSLSPFVNSYNGQTALGQFQDFQWFPTNVQVVQNGGNVAFVPQYQPIPVGINWPQQQVFIPMPAFVPGLDPNVDNVLDQLRDAADGGFPMFTRMNLAPTISRPTVAPPFPITTFITPTFQGGAQGQPVPFTQIIYPPSFSTRNLQTTVSAPIGGNVQFGGFNAGGFGRNAFGPFNPAAGAFFNLR